MSDDWIIIIPEAACYVPPTGAQREAVNFFKTLAPHADDVKAEASDEIRFIDCGANFERVQCPDCGAVIEMDWWRDRMLEEANAGYPLRMVRVRCCHSLRNLNELKYHWQQGFARFTVEAMNPQIADLSDSNLKMFESILGCRVRKVLQHI